jgi:hypothetical protein
MPVHWDVLWLWKPAITNWYTTISFKSRSEEGKSDVRSVSHLAPTWTPEEGRELSRTVMSKKWRGFVYCHFYNQWTDKSWCLLHSCVFSKGTWLEICVPVVMSLSELSSLFYSRPHLYTCFVFLFWLSVHPVVGYDWLFFLVVCQLYMSLWAWSQKFDLQTGSSINSILSSLFSLCCFVFKAVSSAVVVGADTNSTCWTNSIERIFIYSLRN